MPRLIDLLRDERFRGLSESEQIAFIKSQDPKGVGARSTEALQVLLRDPRGQPIPYGAEKTGMPGVPRVTPRVEKVADPSSVDLGIAKPIQGESDLFRTVRSGALGAVSGIFGAGAAAARSTIGQTGISDGMDAVSRTLAADAADPRLSGTPVGDFIENPTLLLDPSYWLKTAANAGGSLIPTLVGGFTAQGAAKLAGFARTANAVVGAAGGALMEGVIEGGASYRETMTMTGGNHELAAEIAAKVAAANFVLSGITLKASGFFDETQKGLMRSILKGSGAEATQEGVQTIISNSGAQNYDPARSLTQGIGPAMLGGALAGGAIGAVTGRGGADPQPGLVATVETPASAPVAPGSATAGPMRDPASPRVPLNPRSPLGVRRVKRGKGGSVDFPDISGMFTPGATASPEAADPAAESAEPAAAAESAAISPRDPVLQEDAFDSAFAKGRELVRENPEFAPILEAINNHDGGLTVDTIVKPENAEMLSEFAQRLTPEEKAAVLPVIAADEDRQNKLTMRRERYEAAVAKDLAETGKEQGPHGKLASLGLKTFPFVPGMPSGGMEDSDHSLYTHPEVRTLLDLPADATWEDQKFAIAQEWMGKDRMSHAAPADWARMFEARGSTWSRGLQKAMKLTLLGHEEYQQRWKAFTRHPKIAAAKEAAAAGNTKLATSILKEIQVDVNPSDKYDPTRIADRSIPVLLATLSPQADAGSAGERSGIAPGQPIEQGTQERRQAPAPQVEPVEAPQVEPVAAEPAKKPKGGVRGTSMTAARNTQNLKGGDAAVKSKQEEPKDVPATTPEVRDDPRPQAGVEGSEKPPGRGRTRRKAARGPDVGPQDTAGSRDGDRERQPERVAPPIPESAPAPETKAKEAKPDGENKTTPPSEALLDKKPAVSEKDASSEIIRRLEAAEKEALERLKRKMGGGTMFSGLDPEILGDLVVVGAAHMARGAISIGKWTAKMVTQFGEGIRQHLASLHELSLAHYEAAQEAVYAEMSGGSPAVEPETKPAEPETKPAQEETKQPEPETEPEKPETGMTDEEVSLVHQQLRFLAAYDSDKARVQNGVGFNKMDTGFGSQLAESPSLTVKQAQAARKMLRKYAGQLERNGFQFDPSDVRPPRGAERKPEQRRTQQLAGDYRIADGEKLAEGGDATRFKNNLAAIEMVRKIETEKRPATREEQGVLAKYIGWGSLSQRAFDTYNRETKELRERLEKLLTPEEYEAARKSTLNAHFTSIEVVDAMWRAMDHLGLRGGSRVLEPSMGTGNFFGRQPSKLMGSRTGVELDRMTAAIAKHLYPGSTVIQGGFESVTLPKNFFDVAIGNVPFGNYPIHDSKYRKFRFLTSRIHNYFFGKTLEYVHPGGVIAYVTSSGTLDASDDVAENTRKYLEERADFLGAIRLPGGKKGAFKQNAGTDVTTDIIFLRRRQPGDASRSIPWTQAQPMTVDGPNGNQEISVNEYFHAHPEMMMGEMTAHGSMRREGMPQLEGELTSAGLDAAIAKLPAGAIEYVTKTKPEADRAPMTQAQAERIREGGFGIEGGKIYQRTNGGLVEVKKKGKHAVRMRSLIWLRDVAREVYRTQRVDAPAEEITAARKSLNKAYDDFVKDHGKINDKTNIRAFAEDPEMPMLMGLEDARGNKQAIFSKRTIQSYKPPTSAGSAKDAYYITLSERGVLDWQRMQDLTGKTKEQMVEELGDLMWQNPETGDYEDAETYLSGEVRTKLRAAIVAAENDGIYERNVEALRKVQPRDLHYSQIKVGMGAPWIDRAYVKQWLLERVYTNGYRLDQQVEVTYSDAAGTWGVTVSGVVKDGKDNQKWMVGRLKTHELIEAALNLKSLKFKDGAGNPDQKANDLAEEFRKAIEKSFAEWVWGDPGRQAVLASAYNEKFNNFALPKYDGAHLQFPGMNTEVLHGGKLDTHQVNAVWRIIRSGNTLLAHVVGAGKTYEMIAAAMEMRRMGLARKPIFVLPKATYDQFALDAVKLYPEARVFKADFSAGARQLSAARIGSGEYDVVLMTREAFNKLPMGAEEYKKFVDSELADLRGALEEAQGQANKAEQVASSRGKTSTQRTDPTVKNIEKQITALEVGIKNRLAEDAKDDAIRFEELGVDQVFVDESHAYKNLMFSTAMDRVVGMSQSASARATDMYMKTRYLAERFSGRGIVFATGTPVSNSFVELFNIMRYMDLPSLKAAGVDKFDAWVRAFAVVEQVTEISPEDPSKFRQVTAIKRFQNLPELTRLFRKFADVKMAHDLNLPTPAIMNGKPTVVEVPASTPLRQLIVELGFRMDKVKGKGPQGRKAEGDTSVTDNALLVTFHGRLGALDMRLIDPLLPDDANSKVNVAVRNIFNRYQDGVADKITQAVFLDISVPKPKTAAQEAAEENEEEEEELTEEPPSLYEDIKEKLIAAGVPSEEIAFIHDAKNSSQKKSLFRKVNEGSVRIILGSTEKLGTGVNIQERLKYIHHLDAPWRPSDIKQRNGRAERQNNSNKEIEILHYVTKDSYDARLWDIVQGKAAMIDQAMQGDEDLREMEDNTSVTITAEEAKAAAQGDTRIKKRIELTRKVDRLKSLESAMASKIADNALQRRHGAIELDLYQLKLAGLKDVLEQQGAFFKEKGLNPEDYTGASMIEGPGSPFKNGEEVQAALLAGKKLTFGGLPIELGDIQEQVVTNLDGKQSQRRSVSVTVGGYGPRAMGSTADLNATGSLLRQIRFAFESPREDAKLYAERIEGIQTGLKSLEKADVKFEYADELKQATQDLSDVIDDIERNPRPIDPNLTEVKSAGDLRYTNVIISRSEKKRAAEFEKKLDRATAEAAAAEVAAAEGDVEATTRKMKADKRIRQLGGVRRTGKETGSVSADFLAGPIMAGVRLARRGISSYAQWAREMRRLDPGPSLAGSPPRSPRSQAPPPSRNSSASAYAEAKRAARGDYTGILARFRTATSAEHMLATFVTSGRSTMQRQGKGGRALAWLIQRVIDYGEAQAGQWVADLAETGITDLSTEQRVALDGQLRGRDSGDESVRRVARQVRRVLDASLEIAMAVGVEIRTPDGNQSIEAMPDFMPAIYREAKQMRGGRVRADILANLRAEGITDPEVLIDAYVDFWERGVVGDRLIQFMKETKQAQGPKGAEAKLRNWRLRVKKYGTFGDAEMYMPFHDPDPARVLPHWFVDGAALVAKHTTFGGRKWKAGVAEQIRRAAQHGGDEAILKETVERSLGILERSKAENTAVDFFVMAAMWKLGLAFISNAQQTINVLLAADAPAVWAGLRAARTASGKQFAVRSGAILDPVMNELKHDAGMVGTVMDRFLGVFSAVERFNRILAANAGADYAGRIYEAHKAGDKRAAQYLSELGVSVAQADARGRLSDAEILMAAKKMSDITQYRNREIDLPSFAKNPVGRLIVQFKTFSYHQMSFTWDQTVGRLADGDVRGARNLFLLATVYPAAGLLVSVIRGALTGRKKKEEKGVPLWWQMWKEGMVSGGALGLFMDIMRVTTSRGGPLGTAINALEFVAGPTAGMLADLVVLTAALKDSTSGYIQGKRDNGKLSKAWWHFYRSHGPLGSVVVRGK